MIHASCDNRGNALFLILIAVALFAALAYAVTQSGRGGSSTTREQSTLDTGNLMDYGASVRTAAMRMTLAGSLSSAVNFDAAGAGADAVFDAAGGAVSALPPPASIILSVPAAGATTSAGPVWRYKSIPADGKGHYIKNIGDPNIPDAFAFIGVNYASCLALNAGLGISTTAESNAFWTIADANEDDPAVANHTMGAVAPANSNTLGKGYAATTPQAFACTCNNIACITTGGGYYIYYHTMIEQ